MSFDEWLDSYAGNEPTGREISDQAARDVSRKDFYQRLEIIQKAMREAYQAGYSEGESDS